MDNNILNPSIQKRSPEFIELYRKYTGEQRHQFEIFISDLVDILQGKYQGLSKNNLQDYFSVELNSFATLFPEFFHFNMEGRLGGSNISVAKDLDLQSDTLDSISIKRLYAFLVNRAESLVNFFTTISPDQFIEAHLFSVDSDFHWYAERPFVLMRDDKRVVVKPSRGANTALLGQLINIFKMEEVACVPKTSYVDSFELQDFILEDEYVPKSKNMSFNWGRLISFSWFLSMRDYHFENIKVSTGKFFLCDNEIILSPKLEKSAYGGRRDSEFVQTIQESIVGTNLLPTRFPENCNLKGVNERGALFFNTLSADIESVVEGFNFQNKINAQNMNDGLDLIRKFLKELKIRCIFRPTNFYAKLLWRGSLSKTYFDSEPYKFKILNTLNKFPAEYDSAYSKVCEQEKVQLELGSFPIFHHGDSLIDIFFRPISVEDIRSSFCERLKSNQEYLLRLCLSVSQDLEKTSSVQKGIGLFESYLDHQEKSVFKSTESKFTRLLSLAYMPTTNEHIVGPIDDGLYNGVAGIISVYPSLSKVGELNRLCSIFIDNELSYQALDNGLSSGGPGIAAAILSGDLCLEHKLSSRVLSLINQRKSLPKISKGGIFESQNGLIYTGLLAASLLSDKGDCPVLSVDSSSQFFNYENFEDVNLGLAHGFVGSQFLKSWYEHEFEKINRANNLDKWRALLRTEVYSKNGICGGLDGLALAISKLQIRYGGYEPLLNVLSDALSQAKALDNKWLCHGYMGQIWSRYIFDLAFESNTLASFEVRKRTNLIINEVKQALIQKKILDVSLFNGALGVLAIDRLLNDGCQPSSSMHIFPSFNST